MRPSMSTASAVAYAHRLDMIVRDVENRPGEALAHADHFVADGAAQETGRGARAVRRATTPADPRATRGRSRLADARRRRAGVGGGRDACPRAARAPLRSQRVALAVAGARSAKRRFSRTVMLREERIVLKDECDAALLRREASRPTRPSRRTSPPAAGNNPAMTRSSVLFPAPDGPTTASVAPRARRAKRRRAPARAPRIADDRGESTVSPT